MFFHPDLRISDADREAAVEFITRHYAAGRLSDAEMAARVDAAYAARYESQLERLVYDLPVLPPEGPPARRPGAGALRPALVFGGLAAAGAGIAAVIPPELWTALLGLGLPLLLMVLFTLAPVLLPVVAVLWLVHAATRDDRDAPRRLGPPVRRPW
jgi:hypothetical protein